MPENAALMQQVLHCVAMREATTGPPLPRAHGSDTWQVLKDVGHLLETPKVR